MTRTRSICTRLLPFLVLLALVPTASAWHVQTGIMHEDQSRFDVADSMEWPAVSPIVVTLPVVEEIASDDPASAPAASSDTDAAQGPFCTSLPATPLPFLATATSPEHLQVYRC